MRRPASAALLAIFLTASLAAQQWTSADAQRATRHYQTGWEHMSREAWAEAAKEFQEAISIDSKFAWQDGFGAFNVSRREIPVVNEYILGQEEHHRTRTFQEEYLAFLEEEGIEYDPKYVW